MDVDRIRLIPLSSFDTPDTRVWSVSDDGMFRVKDAYTLALNSYSQASSSTGADPLWQKLWHLNIPPKAKLFLWRASWNILPHGINLKKKRIENVGLCIRCGQPEDNSHVLFECQWAKHVWAQSSCSIELSQRLSFREWLGAQMDQ